LKKWNLSNNQIREIPIEIGNLNLERLILSGNKIKEIPVEVRNLFTTHPPSYSPRWMGREKRKLDFYSTSLI